MVVKSGQARRAAAGDKQVVWEESVMDIEQVFQTPGELLQTLIPAL